MHLTNTVEDIVAFVRKVHGDERAEQVRNDPDALDFWDQKIEDWSTD